MTEQTNTDPFDNRQVYELLLAYGETRFSSNDELLPPTVAFMLKDGSIRFSESAPLRVQMDILEESRFSDRLLVIVSVAYLEDQLRLLLRSFLLQHEITNDLFDPNTNQLSSLLTMAKLAFSLGLLPKDWFEILKRMANLRNMFAHIPEARSFEDLYKQEKKAAGLVDSLFSRYKELTEDPLSGTHHTNFSQLFRIMYELIQFAVDHLASMNSVHNFNSKEIIAVGHFIGLTKNDLQRLVEGNFSRD